MRHNTMIPSIGNREVECRLCGKYYHSSMYAIYEEEGRILNLERCINSYLPIKVTENDWLPLKVCTKCVDVLQFWDSFTLGCLEVDEKFRKMIHVNDMVTVIHDTHMPIELSEIKTEAIEPNDPDAAVSKPNVLTTPAIEQLGISDPNIRTIIHKIPLKLAEGTVMPTLTDITNTTKTHQYKKTRRSIEAHLMPTCQYKCNLNILPKYQTKIFLRSQNLKSNGRDLARLFIKCMKIGNPDRYYIELGGRATPPMVEVCRSCFMWSVGKYNAIDGGNHMQENSRHANVIRPKRKKIKLTEVEKSEKNQNPSTEHLNSSSTAINQRCLNRTANASYQINDSIPSTNIKNAKPNEHDKRGKHMPRCQQKCRLKFSPNAQEKLFARNYRVRNNLQAQAKLYSSCIKLGNPVRFMIRMRGEYIEVCYYCFMWSVGKYNSIRMDIENYIRNLIVERKLPFTYVKRYYEIYRQQMTEEGLRYAKFTQYNKELKRILLLRGESFKTE